MSKTKPKKEAKWILEIQEEQHRQYVEHLELTWHTVKATLPTVKSVSAALDGLQTLFVNLSDTPIQGSDLFGVASLVGLVRERVDVVDQKLQETQKHWHKSAS